MTHPGDALRLLKEELHALAERYRWGGWVACNGEDIADDIEKVVREPMSDAQRRLSLLRKDLHNWRDSIARCQETNNDPCIRPSDLVTGIQAILDKDKGRIGQRGGYTSETPIDVTQAIDSSKVGYQ